MAAMYNAIQSVALDANGMPQHTDVGQDYAAFAVSWRVPTPETGFQLRLKHYCNRSGGRSCPLAKKSAKS